MSEMDALKAGTSVAAQALEDDSIGSLEPGSTPTWSFWTGTLEDIEAVRDDVAAVYKGGDRVDSRGPVDA